MFSSRLNTISDISKGNGTVFMQNTKKKVTQEKAKNNQTVNLSHQKKGKSSWNEVTHKITKQDVHCNINEYTIKCKIMIDSGFEVIFHLVLVYTQCSLYYFENRIFPKCMLYSIFSLANYTTAYEESQ